MAEDAGGPIEDAGAPIANAAAAPVEDAAIPIMDAGDDAGDSILAQYARRERVISRRGGMVVFEAAGRSECSKLPEKRPADFTLIRKTRGWEPTEWTYYGVSSQLPCRFAWSSPWIEPPAADCKVLDAAAFDKLYAELRKLSPETIRTRQLKEYVSPHRGGWAVHMRWDHLECSISDISHSEVDERDRDRFDAIQNLVFNAYQ